MAITAANRRESSAARTGVVAALAACALDQVTKSAVAAHLVPGDAIPLAPFFNLVLGYNRGVSFGLLSSSDPSTPWLLSGFAAVVILVLAIWLWRSRSRREGAALGLIIGGAAGNVADRIRQGAVTDFLDFHVAGWHWPAFNLADTSIFIGCVALFLVPAAGHRAASAGARS